MGRAQKTYCLLETKNNLQKKNKYLNLEIQFLLS
jgi:hypothetical protein